jgi:hypothetical protein
MDEDYHNSLLLYQQHQQLSLLNASNNNANTPGTSTATAETNQQGQQLSKYAQLLQVLEEMGELVVNYSSLNNYLTAAAVYLGKDIRPTYAGSKSSSERLKRCIVHARILVRECLMETERSARQQ